MINNAIQTLKRIANSGNKGPAIIVIAGCAINLALSAILALPWGGLVPATCRWDCFWYSDIITNGYSQLPLINDPWRLGMANWPFFPLYPALSYIFEIILNIKAQSSGLIVNVILWPALIFLSLKEISLRNVKIDKFLFIIFFLIYPLNVWYTSQYSEAIYGVTLMGAIIALRCEKIELASIACALMSASRPTGFIMSICLALWWLFRTSKKGGLFSRKGQWKNLLPESLLLIGAAGAGLSLFVLYLYHVTGDGFAFAHVEIAWHKKFRFFLFHILHAFGRVSKFQFGIFSILSVVLIWKMSQKKEWRLNAGLIGATALLASSTGVESIERYVFGNPLAIQFLACSVLSRSKRFILISFLIMAVLHIVTTILWYRESWWLI